MAAGSTSGNKRLRLAVISHGRKRRRRQRAPQFIIEPQRGAEYWQFDPARVGILLVLIAHLLGDTLADRGQAFKIRAQLLLFLRLEKLLAQDTVNRPGLI